MRAYFDANLMLELQHLARDRYQRAGGGGVSKVYNSSKAFDDARGYREMTAWNRAVYEAIVRFRGACDYAKSDFQNAGNDYDLMLCERKDALHYTLANIPF